jgi:hypothetical protein
MILDVLATTPDAQRHPFDFNKNAILVGLQNDHTQVRHSKTDLPRTVRTIHLARTDGSLSSMNTHRDHRPLTQKLRAPAVSNVQISISDL